MSVRAIRVPADWQHPQDSNGAYIPLWLYKTYQARTETWDKGKRLWDTKAGKFIVAPFTEATSYEQWAGGPRPTCDGYMPEWSDEQCTHWMMCRIHDDGYTPLSPPMETPELLAQWLADNDVSINARRHAPATEKAWLYVITNDEFSGISYRERIGKWIAWAYGE